MIAQSFIQDFLMYKLFHYVSDWTFVFTCGVCLGYPNFKSNFNHPVGWTGYHNYRDKNKQLWRTNSVKHVENEKKKFHKFEIIRWNLNIQDKA